MATTWLEAGTGATDDFTFWDLGVGTGPSMNRTEDADLVKFLNLAPLESREFVVIRVLDV